MAADAAQSGQLPDDLPSPLAGESEGCGKLADSGFCLPDFDWDVCNFTHSNSIDVKECSAEVKQQANFSSL